MQITCTICSDLFTGNDSESICCTPCGHLFHYICLINWFERVKSCPQCRQKASEKNIIRLYLSLGSTGDDNEDTPDYLKNKVDNLSYQIRLKDVDIKDLKESNEKFKDQNKNLLAHVKSVEDKVRNNQTVTSSLQDQVRLLKNQCKELSSKKLETDFLRDKVESLKHVERLLHGTFEEGNEILKNNKLNHDHLVRSLKLFKREIEEMKKKIQSLKEERNKREKKITDLESRLSSITRDYQSNLSIKTKLEEDLEHVEKEVEKWKKNCLALQKTNETLSSSSAKSNLLKRLIMEEPAPANFEGRTFDSPLNMTSYDVVDISNPSPVEVPKVRSFMNRMNFDESSTISSSQTSQKSSISSISSSSKASSSSLNSCKPSFSSTKSGKSSSISNSYSKPGMGTFSSGAKRSHSGNDVSNNSRSTIRKNRFSMDPWENVEIIKQSTAKADMVYDGLGGHSKVDHFPQPRLNTMFGTKKKKVSNLKVQSKKRKEEGEFPKISSFLKTYDLSDTLVVSDDSD